jgi:hypothetical protein
MKTKWKFLLITICSLLIGLLIYLSIYYCSVQDTKNIIVSGKVYDSITQLPLENVNITIVNQRYEDNEGRNNFDEYLGKDVIETKTNKDGLFEAKISKSAYVWIEVNHEGYQKKISDGKYSTKKMIFNLALLELKN